MKVRRVLVTGAGGLIGRAVTELLAARSVPVTALVLAPGSPPAGRVSALMPGSLPADRVGDGSALMPAPALPAERVGDGSALVPAPALPADRVGDGSALVPASGSLPADRVVVGDAADPAVVADALRDADAVIHLAAIASPLNDPAEVVFGVNTLATFTVLDQAGRAGVRRVSLASSYAICGLPFGPRRLPLPRLPIDTALPLQISDAYALSKRVDEETAAMMHRRYDMTVVALRLPFVGAATDRLATTARRFATEPEAGANDVWSYLDVRDAARAMVAALSPAAPGCHVVYVAAPETLAPQPTDELLARFHPTTPRPSFPGRTVPIDLAPARTLLGFEAEHPYPVEVRHG